MYTWNQLGSTEITNLYLYPESVTRFERDRAKSLM